MLSPLPHLLLQLHPECFEVSVRARREGEGHSSACGRSMGEAWDLLVTEEGADGLRDRLTGRREEQDYCKAQDSSGFHSAEY